MTITDKTALLIEECRKSGCRCEGCHRDCPFSKNEIPPYYGEEFQQPKKRKK